MKGLKLSLKTEQLTRTLVPIHNLMIGRDLALIAGPCSVENEHQTIETALRVKKAGANIFRGGAFKPRTSPYSFQGLGLSGLKILSKAREETGLPIVTEILDPRDTYWVAEYADILQIGARNIQNFPLLKEAGKCGKPILLKRGMQTTLAEWLYSAEYILSEGNPHVILCERGSRTFQTFCRNTLDLSIVAAVKEISHLPVIVDPSHGTGRPDLIPPMCLAAIAAGADGIMVEVHYNPDEAICDKDQALLPDTFGEIALRSVALRAFLTSDDYQSGSSL
ncbi:MAG TPA: 3-deoxy-7-phosphoheptulonate synthase [Firmicutes bacterium]|nr:3-deoxy-7-phosphoheptulonate synthase [Bacillota bacterium]